MASNYKFILTDIGKAKIAAAISDGADVAISTFKVGDGGGNPVTPVSSQTDLVRAQYSGSLNNLTVSGTKIIIEFIVPADQGGWNIAEFGIFDSSGLMIAVGSVDPTYKPTAAEGSTIQMVFKAVMDVGDASVVNLLVDSNILLATREYVVSMTSPGSIFPGGTTNQVLAKASNNDGDTIWLDLADATGVVIDIIEERQTLSDSQTTVTLTTATTDNLAVYINGIRLSSQDWSVSSESVFVLNTPATAGDIMLAVQNDPSGAIDFLTASKHLAEIATLGATAQANARSNIGMGPGQAGYTAIVNAVLDTVYPVGSLYTTTSTDNPATLIGIGTWERYAEGKVVVGYASGDADFGTIGATGGAKTHTLTESEIPAHKHATPSHSGTTDSNGGHAHDYKDRYDAINGGISDSGYVTKKLSAPYNYNGHVLSAKAWKESNMKWPYTDATTDSVAAHSHGFSVPAGETDNTGGGSAHTNLQPYVVANIWRRTA